jgi:hypothetical protein
MPHKVARVGPGKIRQLFNERLKVGDLQETVIANRHPSQPKANEPYCTKSQMVVYRDRKGKKVAMAHRYLRTDNTLGASGRPDPKQFVDGDTLYVVV